MLLRRCACFGAGGSCRSRFCFGGSCRGRCRVCPPIAWMHARRRLRASVARLLAMCSLRSGGESSCTRLGSGFRGARSCSVWGRAMQVRHTSPDVGAQSCGFDDVLAGRLLGGRWEAAGRLLGCYWETAGRLLGYWEAPGRLLFTPLLFISVFLYLCHYPTAPARPTRHLQCNVKYHTFYI